MNSVVIGLGSMGRRRIRLIKKHNPGIKIWGIDTNAERRKVCFDEYGIEIYENLESFFSERSVDCAFICTSPLSHAGIIGKCLKNKINVFTEINLVTDGYEENLALAKENEVVLFISSTFLYREEIKRINTYVKDAGTQMNYTYHVGQYLPDWHPWEDYKDFFVSEQRTNGCRELFAIELPWLTAVFGKITNAYAIKDKISKLDLSYNDSYLVTLVHENGHKGILAVDVVSRKAVRNFEVYSENLYLEWNGTPDGLKIYDYLKKEEQSIHLYDEVDQLENYSRSIVENAYYSEITTFFSVLAGHEELHYDFNRDKEILGIIDAIESIGGECYFPNLRIRAAVKYNDK